MSCTFVQVVSGRQGTTGPSIPGIDHAPLSQGRNDRHADAVGRRPNGHRHERKLLSEHWCVASEHEGMHQRPQHGTKNRPSEDARKYAQDVHQENAENGAHDRARAERNRKAGVSYSIVSESREWGGVSKASHDVHIHALVLGDSAGRVQHGESPPRTSAKPKESVPSWPNLRL